MDTNDLCTSFLVYSEADGGTFRTHVLETGLVESINLGIAR